MASPGVPRRLALLSSGSVLALWVLLVAPRLARADEPQTWLTALHQRVIEDLAAGQPLVMQVHAPLCEATILPCGSERLGDGESLETNLYWATSAGFGRWFRRKGGGWKRVFERRGEATGDPDVLSLAVYRRTLSAPASWRRRGAPARFAAFVVVHGWRGKAIDRALEAFARQSSGQDELLLEEGELRVRAGGAAHLVAYSGHNRLMDVPAYRWPPPAERPIGAIAVACLTAEYLQQQATAATRIPLLLTRDFLFANAAPVEAVLLAFARGDSYAAIRRAAATAYAGVQKKDPARVLGAFTNPGDKRWTRR